MPRGCRNGEFPDAELGMELVTSQNAARDTMDQALDLETRLPRTWAALGAGLIDEYRARLIWRPTRHLTDADAARADEILAALAPGLRYDQLAHKATAVAMKLDPEAFTRGKEQARADRQRVVAGREDSGNAFLSGRELVIEDALASKAHIDALAVALRKGGLPGTLQRLRVLAFNDLTQGRHPLDRLTGPGQARPPQGGTASKPAASPAATPAQGTAAAATVVARARCPAASLVTTPAPAAMIRQAAATALTPATAMMMMMMPAGTVAPTCPNGSMNAAAPPKTTAMTTTTAPRPRPGRRRRSPR